MTEWIPCGKDFIDGDVIRWSECAWEECGLKRDELVRTDRRWKKRCRKPHKLVKVADLFVTAEVLRQDAEWVFLLIRACDATYDNPPEPPLIVLQRGDRVRRKRTTIEKGRAVRLRWSDETVRERVSSEVADR